MGAVITIITPSTTITTLKASTPPSRHIDIKSYGVGILDSDLELNIK